MLVDILKTKTPQRRQHGGFLNRYDFLYAGRDTKNTGLSTLRRITPGLTENVIH